MFITVLIFQYISWQHSNSIETSPYTMYIHKYTPHTFIHFTITTTSTSKFPPNSRSLLAFLLLAGSDSAVLLVWSGGVVWSVVFMYTTPPRRPSVRSADWIAWIRFHRVVNSVCFLFGTRSVLSVVGSQFAQSGRCLSRICQCTATATPLLLCECMCMCIYTIVYKTYILPPHVLGAWVTLVVLPGSVHRSQRRQRRRINTILFVSV